MHVRAKYEMRKELRYHDRKPEHRGGSGNVFRVVWESDGASLWCLE